MRTYILSRLAGVHILTSNTTYIKNSLVRSIFSCISGITGYTAYCSDKDIIIDTEGTVVIHSNISDNVISGSRKGMTDNSRGAKDLGVLIDVSA